MKPLVAPDTGLYLAHGYGEEIDPKGPVALVALNRAQELTTVVHLSSVHDELKGQYERMLNSLEAIRDMRAVVLELDQESTALQIIEKLMTKVRSSNRDGLSRFYDAIEAELARYAEEYPGDEVERFLAPIFSKACFIQEMIKTRIEALSGDSFDCPGSLKDTKKFTGVGRRDSQHLRCSQALGDSKNRDVIFLVLESKLLSFKAEIEEELSRVKITNPTYLKEYFP